MSDANKDIISVAVLLGAIKRRCSPTGVQTAALMLLAEICKDHGPDVTRDIAETACENYQTLTSSKEPDFMAKVGDGV